MWENPHHGSCGTDQYEGVRKNLQDLGFGQTFWGVFKEVEVCS